jgi:hypothetical protein
MSPSALFVTTVPITLEAFLVPLRRALPGAGMARRRAGQRRHREPAHRRCVRQPLRRGLEPQPARRAQPRRHLGRGAADRRRGRLRHRARAHAHRGVRHPVRTAPAAAATRPVVIYTAHGFHFYRGQRATPPRSSARWSDRRPVDRLPRHHQPGGPRGGTRFAASRPSACATSPASAWTCSDSRRGGRHAEEAAAVRQELDTLRPTPSCSR